MDQYEAAPSACISMGPGLTANVFAPGATGFREGVSDVVHGYLPGTPTFAGGSTGRHGVAQPVSGSSPGFALKWNMGWMHDTLRSMSHQPVHRECRRHEISHGLGRTFSENLALAPGHTRAVRGNGSVVGRWEARLASDNSGYGRPGAGHGPQTAWREGLCGLPFSPRSTLPTLATLFLTPE